MVLLDLLGRRWAFRILFELDAHGTLTFSELMERCGTISPSVLSQRLSELTENHIIEQRADGYGLTRVARSLREPLAEMYDWSIRWAKTVNRQNAKAKKKRSSKKR